FLVKFGSEIVLFAVASLVPNEYLQQIQNGFVKTFSALGKIVEYFGYGKRVNQLSNMLQRFNHALKDPTILKWLNRLSAAMDGLSPNLGMKILENLLNKLFPEAATE